MEAPSPPAEAQTHQPPLRVLFLCTENSARSQMAEALLRHLSHERIEAYSAGSHPTQVHPLARQVLGQCGIFTHYLAQVSPTWNAKVGAGYAVNWPVGIGFKGNGGVADEVQNFTGSIGYVELSYALRFYIVNAPGATAYPISGFSWVIIYQQQENADKGWALANLFWWRIHYGQQFSEPLHYAVLPDTMVAKSAAQIRLMTSGSGHTPPCYRG